MDLPRADTRPLLTRERLVLAASVLLVWFLAWAYPLLPPDEGRYGSVSATMAESGNWLVPEFRGKAHLTKPPLTYWLQGIGVVAMGRTELAVRWPSLVATSLGLLVLFRFARRTLGTRPALVATALASCMPLVLVVGRLANTDALLALAWIVMLDEGHAIATDDSRRTPWGRLLVFWLALAFGFMVKGPAALGPLIVLGAWLAMAGRGDRLLQFQPFLGFPLAAIPAAIWIGFVLHSYPSAKQLWWDETFGRVTGEKSLRAEPWWFYLPVYLAGLYPATTMLAVPFLNLRPKAAWAILRSGDVRSLAILAVVLPLVGLSLSTGKMPTYLLPLAAPTAILVAITIERWLDGSFDRRDRLDGYRPPDVRLTLAVVACIVFLGQLGASIYAAESAPELWALVVPLAIVPIACITMATVWKQGSRARWQGLAVAWLGFAASWTVVFGIVARYVPSMGSAYLLAELRPLLGTERPRMATVGFLDPTIAFYNGGQATIELADLAGLPQATSDQPDLPTVVLLRASRAEETLAACPEVARRLEPLGTWTRWFASPTRFYLLTRSPEGPASPPTPPPVPPGG